MRTVNRAAGDGGVRPTTASGSPCYKKLPGKLFSDTKRPGGGGLLAFCAAPDLSPRGCDCSAWSSLSPFPGLGDIGKPRPFGQGDPGLACTFSASLKKKASMSRLSSGGRKTDRPWLPG